MKDNYDAKWTGYGHVVTIKSYNNDMTRGSKHNIIRVDGQLKASIDDNNHARALFTGFINMIRDGQVS